MQCKKLLNLLVITYLICNIAVSYALVGKISLLTKKLKNNTTHCIWVLHDFHENYLNIHSKTKIDISNRGKKEICTIAKKLNAHVYVEDVSDLESMPDFNSKYLKVLFSFFTMTMPRYLLLYLLANNKTTSLYADGPLLFNLYNFLKKQDIKVQNVENRAFALCHHNYNTIKYSFLSIIYLMYLVTIHVIFTKKLSLKIAPVILFLIYNLFFSSKIPKLKLKNEIDKLKPYIDHVEEKTKTLFTQIKQQYKKAGHTPSYICPELNYSHYNDIYTIIKILKQQKKASKFINKKEDHAIVITGAFHSQNVEKALINPFGYKKIQETTIPSYKKLIKKGSTIDPEVNLKIERCFEKGLLELKNV